MAKGLVLVIEDDQAIVEVLHFALEEAGYEVVTAVDGAALPLAHERLPDVILLDVLMPVMDGEEVSRRLRADPATAHTPIIAMSATPHLLTALPVQDRLSKPFGLDLVLAKVAHWTRHAPGRRLHWRDAGARSYAFDRTTRRVVAACMQGTGGLWWVVIRQPVATYGPFATLEQARSEAEKYLLA
jgi:CheY-like chemotaxis protein